MKKIILITSALAICSAFALTACGGSSSSSDSSASATQAASGNYADGTYTGQSTVHKSDDEVGNLDAGYGVATITIKDGKITECEYKTYQEDGTLKDEEYGKQDGEVANRDYYNKAQKAVAACEEYAKAIVENNGFTGVDCISGATINYTELEEAVNDALSQAEGK